MIIFLQVLVHNTILNNLNIGHCNTCIYIFLTVSYSKFAFANMRAINKCLLIKTIFNISHNYNYTLSLVCFLNYAFHISTYPNLALLMHYMKGEDTGIYYIDSTKLAICHNKRTASNRVFNRISKIGKSSYGWFLGFKLHLVINHKCEIMSVKITKANKSDLSVASVISKGLFGKLFGDKAYISKDLFHQLLTNGIRLFTNLRNDMKTYLLDIDDKRLLNKRSLIESVFNVLKKHMHLERQFRIRKSMKSIIQKAYKRYYVISLNIVSINNSLFIEIIFNISHNHNCTLSLVALFHYAFHISPYPKLAL
ncbi:transposase [Orientia tsutsugamushi]|nr:transposase [Orientia tsutsugamushi]